MLIAWQNLADLAVVTAGSEIVTLPASSVQIPHLSRKWHTLAGVKSSHLIWDLGAPASMGIGILLGTNLTAAATVRWRGSDADPTVTSSLLSDTGVVNAGVKPRYKASYKSWVHVAARYWRSDIADATLPDNLQIGRALPMPYWQPAVNQEWGWGIAPIDQSPVAESYGGQEYPDPRPRRRQAQFMLNWLTKAEAFDNALVMALDNGITRDVLAIHDIADTYLSEQAVWGLMTALEPIFNRHTLTWSQKFTVKERL